MKNQDLHPNLPLAAEALAGHSGACSKGSEPVAGFQDRRNRESQSRLEKDRTPSRLLLVADCLLQSRVGN